MLAGDRLVYTVDLRNHGLSPHASDFDYGIMADDLIGFIRDMNSGPVILIGHSMGGKVAMLVSVREPGLVSKLIVVDMVPKSYTPHHDHILEGMLSMPLDRFTNRQEADAWLAGHVPDAGVRQFLLKNLSRSESGFSWKINLPVIAANIGHILDNPVAGIYSGPTLFVMGSRSDYFKPEDQALWTEHFPTHQLTFLDTGHWVQAEKPAEFVETVQAFIHA